MGLDVGGFTETPDWPKFGPSLLIATCLIVAIRTAKWTAIADAKMSGRISIRKLISRRTSPARGLARLMRINEVLFPQRKEPWYQPDGEDEPK